MTIDFPVLSPVCSILQFKVDIFCLNNGKIEGFYFCQIGAYVYLVWGEVMNKMNFFIDDAALIGLYTQLVNDLAA